jgi:hypothetical protein
VENSQTSTPWYADASARTTVDGGSGGQQAPVLQQAGQKVSEVADQARTQVMSKLGDQKERAAGSLEGVAQALRQTGQQFRDQNQQPFGQFAEGAADMVERFTGYLNQRDVHQMVGEVESFARRQPALFLGGAFALGLLAARFLKSSSDGSSYDYAPERWSSNAWSAQQPAAAPISSYDAMATSYPAAPAAATLNVGSISDTPAVAVDVDDEELVPVTGDRTSARLDDDA